MNALSKLRTKSATGIIGLLWVNVLLILARLLFRAEGVEWVVAVAALAVAAIASLSWRADRVGPTTMIISASAHAATVALLVYCLQGSPLQIDAHMYFFASLAVCAAWVDWRPIVAFSTFVALHHLVLYVAMPMAVFPGTSDFSRVMLHAVVLVTQATALIVLSHEMKKAFLSADSALKDAEAATRDAIAVTQRLKEAEAIATSERQERAHLDRSEGLAVAQAVDTLRNALTTMASGDLTARIDQPLHGHIDELRTTFNTSTSRLLEVLRNAKQVAVSVREGAWQMSRTNQDLAQRTERQALSVSEVAGSLTQVAKAANSTSALTVEVKEIVSRASAKAGVSGDTVEQALSAMVEIEKSSSQIDEISSVIDEIAFQTNLLALNAGVEAARAGDSGKGFAVVASEVRELAQRSARAAKEIKLLVETSAANVASGVRLVDGAASALRGIAGEVEAIRSHIDEISRQTREQSSGIAEIAKVVEAIDMDTQSSATMVQQSSISVQGVALDADVLDKVVDTFNLSFRNHPGQSALYAA